MKRIKLSTASALITIFLAACGGGGGGTPVVPPDTSNDTVISGIATKGPITGTINIYALSNSGSKGSLLKSASIVDGSYSANIGKYAGPVVIEVTGSYTDEATGQAKTIAADAPMRAAISDAAGTISVPVTPLTELAVQKAGALTASGIDTANKLVSDIFKFDIIATLPVAPTSTAFSGSSVTQEQKDYTLALAALSQMSKDETLSATLADVAASIGSSGMNSQTVTIFQNAVTDFMSNSNNKTGVTDKTATNLANINGGTTATYKLAIVPIPGSTIGANTIKGLQFEIVIPNGLTIRYDPNSIEFSTNPVTYDPTKGRTLPGVVTASSSIAAAQPHIEAVYSSASGVLIFGLYNNNSGIGAGDLATITCDVLPGWAVPAASAFSVINIKAVDGSAATIGSVNVTVN